MWVWCNGSIPAFQAVSAGSNPVTHSYSKKVPLRFILAMIMFIESVGVEEC